MSIYSFYENKDDNNGLWIVILLLFLAFIVIIEILHIMSVGFRIGTNLKITKFQNLDGILTSFVVLILFLSLIVASGFCCELFLSNMPNGFHFDADLWIIPLLVKGYFAVHLLFVLPLFLFIKIIHFFSWVFKVGNNSTCAYSRQSLDEQNEQIVTNEKIFRQVIINRGPNHRTI